MQNANPVLSVPIIGAMPLKVAGVMFIAGKREKEGRTIKTVFLSELSKLLRSGLLSEHRDRRIARHELDEDGDQRHDCPDDQQQDGESSQSVKQLVLYC